MSELVSIIISAYNAEAYIEETIRSVLSQTYKNLEIIVVNDGSTDGTGTILDKYSEKGVIHIKQHNSGQDAALNNGFRHSTGKYIKFMDSDDLINPEMIELQVKALQSNPSKIAYGEWSRFFNNDPQTADFVSRVYYKNMAPIDFMTTGDCGPMLQCAIMLIPREIVLHAGLWDERLILFNDTEFFTRILLASEGTVFTPKAKLYYRSGNEGTISVGRARKFYESTFLATQLMAEHLMAREDSPRVRRLISNTFLMQMYNMYPQYADLADRHSTEAEKYGFGDLKVRSGKMFNILSDTLGWRNAIRIKQFIQSR